jgi:hypothetical protein
MNPVFWKLSMGKDFKNILEVLDWIRLGVVLVHKDTKEKGIAKKSQGEDFVDPDRMGDYFYLCHGNQEPSIILLGQFTGPANLISARQAGWAERPFRWLKTSILTKPYTGEAKWWAPNHNSTFVKVRDDELTLFESSILGPYFGITLADFRIGT